jgi:hypothetical protein
LQVELKEVLKEINLDHLEEQLKEQLGVHLAEPLHSLFKNYPSSFLFSLYSGEPIVVGDPIANTSLGFIHRGADWVATS